MRAYCGLVGSRLPALLAALCVAGSLTATAAAAEPSLVKDITPGPDGTNIFTLAAGTDVLYAYIDDGVHGRELWKSDGSDAGTKLVADISPGAGSSFFSAGMTTIGNTAFFSADDGTHGVELWKSDGTQAGTKLVKDIRPGSGSSEPGEFVVVDGALYFSANDGTHERELWKSDGSEANTVLVKDARPPGYGVYPADAGGGDIYLRLRGADHAVYFEANDGTHGPEVWRSTGTEAGTEMLKDGNPSTNVFATPECLTAVGDAAYFTENDGTHSYELWRSDGSQTGTGLLKDIYPGSGESFPCDFVPAESVVYFDVNDDGVNGRGLWKTNGTEAGTELVKAGVGGGGVAVGDELYFPNFDEHGSELWVSDGTAAGTHLLKDIQPGDFVSSYPGNLVAVRDSVFFTASDSTNGLQLWSTDGTEEGTVPHAATIGGFVPVLVGETLFFYGTDGDHGYELWKLPVPSAVKSADGTAAPGGTVETNTAVSPDDPIGTSVTTPTGGFVSISEDDTTTSQPAAYSFLGVQVNITAPPASVAQPLQFVFRLDPSLLPASIDATTLQIFRNGAVVADCTGAVGTASPNPCVQSRVTETDGSLTLTVLTSDASAWNFGQHDPYAFQGFFRPIANPPAYNTVKAGSTVPVGFSLGGDQGTRVFASGYPRSHRISCTAPGTSLGDDKPTAGKLTYDRATARYNYKWETLKSWAAPAICRQAVLRLLDGTEHSANFKFVK